MKKRLWLGVLVVIILGGIGGKRYMDKREEDRQELLEIQKDLANYVYNNYRLYTTNDEETDRFTQEYSNGGLTTEEYVEKVVSVRKYIDIDKIEFTGYTVSPMNFLEVHFLINDSNKQIATLGVKSSETDNWIYNIDIGIEKSENKYYIEINKTPNVVEIPNAIIIFYHESDITMKK
ncbi:hypothetical protein [Enterococcus mundtii]|uniref:hypothetical protein n=1 Tax=Enterococcus mundtii TaxID=53346 RepID=UPI001377B54D|nr:hypothetical protein [Enterococcus mundtii]NBA61547.1 hypothetical protein [Enterococcus mundtii]